MREADLCDLIKGFEGIFSKTEKSHIADFFYPGKLLFIYFALLPKSGFQPWGEKAGRKIGYCWCNQHSMGRCLLVREIDREDRYTSISSLTASPGRASG
jgi:hypothetical protein